MSPDTTTRTTVTVVTSPGCHFCHDAEQILEELAGQDATIRVDLVEATTDAGRALLTEHRPTMNPLVLVDGAYFSAGRLPRRKLQHLLDHRAANRAHHG